MSKKLFKPFFEDHAVKVTRKYDKIDVDDIQSLYAFAYHMI